jgi:tetratricopeptide (TPR) repeat protein
MHDTAERIETAPSLSPAPAPLGRRRRVVRFLLAPVSFVRRRPLRALAVLAVSLLAGVVLSLSGLFLWFGHNRAAARQALDRGHNALAIQYLLRCRQLFPNDPEVLLLSARAARRSDAWDEAEALLDQYWQQRGDDDALVLERLLLRATRGEVESAAAPLQARIARDDPAAPLAREALIAGLLYRFHLAEAEKHIDDWLQHDPNSTLALMAQARLAENRDQTSEAANAYRRVLEIDPDHDEARLRMTSMLLELRQSEEALGHLEYLHRHLPASAEVQLQLAQALDLQGRPDEARALLDGCLRLHPNHAGALAERARIASRDGDGTLAEDYLRRAVEIDPGNANARYQFYLVLHKNGKEEAAQAELEARRRIEADIKRIKEIVEGPLQKRPNDPQLHYEIALIAQRAGKPREMLRWLQRALKVGPNHAPTHRALAAYYHQFGNPILAARHRALAVQLEGQKK